MSSSAEHGGGPGHTAKTRRDFLYVAAAGVGAVGVGAFVWPFIDSMNPAADVLALASVEVDVAPIAAGQGIKIKWQGKPVFVRHRNAEEIAEAEDTDWQALRDPQSDADRVQKPEWLVVIGICTHLGCVPLGTNAGEPRGEWNGWFCPCHGSHYDTSGRIRKGPAPLNLAVPPYEFTGDTTIKIG